ncbi:MAG: glycosyltransferase family 39 protein [Actinobacteria bacterium]|nr:glycosyltransferase family 39 protein [Actinomycetota bacterium]
MVAGRSLKVPPAERLKIEDFDPPAPVSCPGASSLTRALDHPPQLVPHAARPLRAADADRPRRDRGARPGRARGRRRPSRRRSGRRLARLLRPRQVALPGRQLGSIRILEALMGVGTILVVFLLGWRLGGRWPALLGALGVAIYPPFIHSVGEVMSEPPAMLSMPAAILAFLWAWDGKSPWRWLLPGFLFGCTAMFRPEYTLVAAAFVVFAAVRWAWQREWAFGAAAIGLMLVALLLPILPWTIRNIVVLDRLVPISTGGGKALYVGTFYPADGEYQRVKAILYERETGESLPPQSQELAEVDPTPLFDKVAARYPELPRDSALGKIGKEDFSKYFGEDPLGYVGMTVRKVGRMWSSGVGEFMSTTLGRVLQIVLVLLGIAGLVLLGFHRRRLEALCFATPIVLVTLVGAISLAAPRRNEILMTLIFPLAGLAVSTAAAALSSGRKWSQ